MSLHRFKKFCDVIKKTSEGSITPHDLLELTNFKSFEFLGYDSHRILNKELWEPSQRNYYDTYHHTFCPVLKPFLEKHFKTTMENFQNHLRELPSLYHSAMPDMEKYDVDNSPKSNIQKILDCSNNFGRCIPGLKYKYPNSHITTVEKNILMGTLLKEAYKNDQNVSIITGEGIRQKLNEKFDLSIGDISSENQRNFESIHQACKHLFSSTSKVVASELKKCYPYNAGELLDLVKGNDFCVNLDNEIVPCTEFFSGNILSKIENISKHGQEYFKRFVKDFGVDTNENIFEGYKRKLKAILPVKTLMENMDVGLGDAWIPIDIIKGFLKVGISLYKQYCHYKVQQTNAYAIKGTQGNIQGNTVLEKILNKENANFTYKDGNKIRPDVVANKNFAVVKEKLNGAFKNYILQNKTVKQYLENYYYRTFTAVIPKQSGQNLLEFPRLRGNTPLPYQKQACQKILTNHGGVLDLCTNSDGNLTSFMIIDKLLESGKAARILFTAAISKINELQKKFSAHYPNYKVSHIGESQNKEEKLSQLESLCKKNNSQVIFMSEDTYQMIPNDPKIEKEYLHEKLKKNNRKY